MNSEQTKNNEQLKNDNVKLSKVVILNKQHKKKEFYSGNEILDDYLHKVANQDLKRDLSICYVMADEENNIYGYFTLSNQSIPYSHFDESFRKKLNPSYNQIPTTLLGRLAVSQSLQGQNFGRALLMMALKKAYDTSKVLASAGVVVDPIDENAIEFYKRFGFIKIPDSGRMYLHMKTIENLLNRH
ncbi:GNAT family N-acetyltransferase [Empedobacter falsenii]|uniref:GNAT family N-acetyltransferase n=1 Tax=Empedobacter falsenii TaxID=343874 RepID=UPI00068EC4DA|nr:GNAT family N-acetyltransferase [Empedobacter falsenii]